MYTDEYGNRRFPALYRGVVFDNRDPLEKGRLQLQVPQVLADATTDWAWGKVPAGAQKYTPAIGEGVWVQFEGGDPSYPVWLGTFAQTLPDINAVLPATWDYSTQTIGVDQDAFTHISTLDYAQFNATSTSPGSTAPGSLSWNNTDGTLEVRQKDGDVTLQIGQEELVRVVNKTGALLPEGSAVYVVGAHGQRLKAALADASAETGSATTLGVVTHSGGIADNGEGYVTVSGLVRGLQLPASSFTEGAVLWLSTTPGQWSTTRPTAPDHGVQIGYVVNTSQGSGKNGSIYVHVQNGYELAELHSVLLDDNVVTPIVNNEVLAFTSTTGVWQNKTASEAGLYGTTNLPSLDNLSDVIAPTPSNNDLLKYVTGTGWINSPPAGYMLSSITAYTTGTTWTKPTGCRAIRVRLVGGGGAGGGPGGGNNTRAGGGGGAGGYAESFIVVPSSTSSYSYSIGAGGTGSKGSAGNDGGTTSFGSTLVVATGGTGGGSNGDGGTGGTGTAGNVTFTGGSGGSGGSKRETVSGVQLDFMSAGGNGGASFFGGGGAGTRSYSSAPGSAGIAKGSGGGGGVDETESNFGGAGAPGIIIVEVYV